MPLTEWNDIGGVLLAVFLGMATMLILVVHLEQWLIGGTEPPKLAAVPPVQEHDDLDDKGAA